METAVESRIFSPRAPGPSNARSGFMDLTTSETQTDRSAGVAGRGFSGPAGRDVSRKASTRGGPVEEIGRELSTSPATFPTHSSLLAPDSSNFAGETPPSGAVPSAPSTP